MLALAELLCKQKKIDFKYLYPVIKELGERAVRYSPLLTQTGPAIRNDTFVMTRHLSMLSKDEDLKCMHLKLTENIIKMHSKG